MAALSLYTEEIAAEICSRLADGESLRTMCEDKNMPCRSTVMAWLADDQYAEFKRCYDVAREEMAHALFEELREIADDGRNDWMERQRQDGSNEIVFNGEHVQRSKLRVDTLKWQCSKLLPKVYGDRLNIDNTLEVRDARSDDEIKARVVALVDELGMALAPNALPALTDETAKETEQ